MSDEEQEKSVVLCGSVDLMSEDQMPGCTQIEADCGHQVWVSPSTLQQLERKEELNLETVCMTCVFTNFSKYRALRESIKEHGMQQLPGAHEELVESLGEEKAQELKETFFNKPQRFSLD